jgi:hypothetical protein
MKSTALGTMFALGFASAVLFGPAGSHRAAGAAEPPIAPRGARGLEAFPDTSPRLRIAKDTLHLRPSFADHFPNAGADILNDLRRELRVGGTIIPSSAKLDLNDSRDVLIIEFRDADLKAVEKLEDAFVQAGWLRDPKEIEKNRITATTTQLVQRLRPFSEVAKTTWQIAKDKRRAADDFARLHDIVDSNPLSKDGPVSNATLAALQKAAADSLERLHSLRLQAEILASLNPESVLQEAAAGAGPASPMGDPAPRTDEDGLKHLLESRLKKAREDQAAKIKTEEIALQNSKGRLHEEESRPEVLQDLVTYRELKEQYLEAKRVSDEASLQYETERFQSIEPYAP